eukprot:scaffold1878_cov113-Isochrysis_galbana.AAC.10
MHRAPPLRRGTTGDGTGAVRVPITGNRTVQAPAHAEPGTPHPTPHAAGHPIQKKPQGPFKGLLRAEPRGPSRPTFCLAPHARERRMPPPPLE